MHRLFALTLALASFGLCGFLNSWTSPAYTSDPATCSHYTGACDPAIGDAVASFPYWDYRAGPSGYGGTHFFLGTAGGYLWGVTCAHCQNLPTWEFVSGPYAGQVFDTVDFDGKVGTGEPYRQFGLGNHRPVGNAARGDLLFRLVPRPGHSLPDLPFMRLLTGLEGLRDGGLMLAIGNGRTGTHPTLGWFTECATSEAGGRPSDSAGGRPSCCTDERWAGYYGPSFEAFPQCFPPYMDNPASFPDYHVCWGGEGDFNACTAAGLTYLGPVFDSSPQGAWHWGTWTFLQRSVTSSSSSGKPYTSAEWKMLRAPTPIGDSAGELGQCVTWAPDVFASGAFEPRRPPVNRVKSQMMCSTDRTQQIGKDTLIAGDSGSGNFAYINGVWFYVGSGDAAGHPSFHTLPEQQRDEWTAWIYGATDDRDGDKVPDLSDNCIDVPNGVAPNNQCDTDQDGYGNSCDGDFDNDYATIPWDQEIFKAAFTTTGVDDGDGTDMDCDGYVTPSDWKLFLPQFKTTGVPGPSGLFP